MIRDTLAYFFRSLNANLLYTSGSFTFKLFKGIHFLSRLAYKKWRHPSRGLITLSNFDRDIRINLDPTQVIGGAIYWTGFHELREMIFLNKFLKPEMVFFDIGANLGEFTLFVAKRVPHGNVVAFEPLPKMADLLRQNVDLNQFRNVKTMRIGLSDSSRSVPLFTPESGDENEGLATLYPDSKSGTSTMIELRTLDGEFGKLGLQRLDVIKMDIEGAELPALKGSRSILEKFRPVVIIEINDKTFGAAGYSVEAVMEFFTELEYKSFQLNKTGTPELIKALPRFGNVVFMRAV